MQYHLFNNWLIKRTESLQRLFLITSCTLWPTAPNSLAMFANGSKSTNYLKHGMHCLKRAVLLEQEKPQRVQMQRPCSEYVYWPLQDFTNQFFTVQAKSGSDQYASKEVKKFPDLHAANVLSFRFCDTKGKPTNTTFCFLTHHNQ